MSFIIFFVFSKYVFQFSIVTLFVLTPLLPSYSFSSFLFFCALYKSFCILFVKFSQYYFFIGFILVFAMFLSLTSFSLLGWVGFLIYWTYQFFFALISSLISDDNEGALFCLFNSINHFFNASSSSPVTLEFAVNTGCFQEGSGLVTSKDHQ